MNNFQTKEVAVRDCVINGVQYVAVGFVDTKVAIALCGVVGADDEAYSREIAAHIATMWNAHSKEMYITVEGVLYKHIPYGLCKECAAHNTPLCGKFLYHHHSACCHVKV